MRVMIADSDVQREQRLRERLGRMEGAELLATCNTAGAAVAMLREEEPDLLLVEASLPGAGSLALLRECDESQRPVSVVIAADTSWALAAFEVGASGYLVWPADEARLEQCLGRVQREVHWRLAGAASDSAAVRRFTMDRVVLRVGERFVFRPVAELEFAEAERNYVKLVFGAESSRVRIPIGEIERRMDPASFIRIHRSTIVNRSHIAAVETAESGEMNIILRSRTRLRTGRSYRSAIRGLLACTG